MSESVREKKKGKEYVSLEPPGKKKKTQPHMSGMNSLYILNFSHIIMY